MNEPVFGVDLAGLGVHWSVKHSPREVSPAMALDAASTALRRGHARIDHVPHDPALKCRWSFRAGRSWLSCVSGGHVRATVQAERLSVIVRASLAPLIAVTLFAAVGSAVLA